MKFKFEDLLDEIVEDRAEEDLKKPESQKHIMMIMQGMPRRKKDDELSKKYRE